MAISTHLLFIYVFMILTIITFIIVLGILIIVHEFGHFIVAKKVGVKVLEFAIGFPPRIAHFKKGETKYAINAIPIGGYVKMLGELEHSKDKRAFENQKPSKRFAISIAGVVMNFVLAWLLLTIGFEIGMSPIVTDPNTIPGKIISSEIIIADTVKDSPAEAAKIQAGDVLISGTFQNETKKFASAKEVSDFTGAHHNQSVIFQIKRDNKEINQEVYLSGTADVPFGVSMIDKSIVRATWYMAPYVALKEVGGVTKLTFQFLGGFFKNLFSKGQVSEEVGGPVAIYVYTGLAVRAGILVLIQFVALLSINLGLINILPFPALDGGRILFIILERISGKRVVKESVENIIHTIGFAILILLILAITYKDVVKLFVK